MNDLKPHEWQILADILTLAAEEFDYHGCNDIELLDTPENRQFVTMAEIKDQGEKPENHRLWVHKGNIVTSDSGLMRHFARYARQMANQCT